MLPFLLWSLTSLRHAERPFLVMFPVKPLGQTAKGV